MDVSRLETLTVRRLDAAQREALERQEADRVATQFEALFVRNMVASLRQSSSMGGEGGMFGSGPGADTYADWFDDNLATQLGNSGGIGIKQALLAEFARARNRETAQQDGGEPARKASGAAGKPMPLQSPAAPVRALPLTPSRAGTLRQDGLRTQMRALPLEKDHGSR